MTLIMIDDDDDDDQNVSSTVNAHVSQWVWREYTSPSVGTVLENYTSGTRIRMLKPR